MDTTESIIFLLLLTAALSGAWFAGYRSRFGRRGGLQRQQPDYFIGLNYLLNDKPDDAIDLFIAALEISSGTLETHLALGTLLRRRGKVDRAIEHCQRLLDKGGFDSNEKARIGINLVRSYIAAGLLDRAEEMLGKLEDRQSPVREDALEISVVLFQKEQDWQRALVAAHELLDICGVTRRAEFQLQCSHFHCELAEAALGLGDYATAQEQLDKALAVCRWNVRIHFLLARVASARGAPIDAVKHLQQIRQYDPEFAGEACPLLLKAMQFAGMEKQLVEMLETIPEASGDTRMLLALVAAIRNIKGDQAAYLILQQQLRRSPSLELLAESLQLAVWTQQGQEAAGQGAAVLQQYLQGCAHYRCENCGLQLRSMHWLCPGCSRWGTVKPLEGRLPHL